MYYSNYRVSFTNSRMYMATFEKLTRDHKKFRAWNDFKAMERAAKISEDNDYGAILNIYEVAPYTGKILRNIFGRYYAANKRRRY